MTCHRSTTAIRPRPFEILKRVFVGIILLTAAEPLFADGGQVIMITGAGSNRMPIIVTPFSGERAIGLDVSSVIRADLDRSGMFRIVEGGNEPFGLLPPAFGELRERQTDFLVTGSVVPANTGDYQTEVRLHDVPRQTGIGGQAYKHTLVQSRATGHRIADFICEKLTGDRCIFSTRIAFVLKEGSRYRLQIADSDGGSPATALTSNEPIISPSWSPDGSKLAYVSFEAKKPVVYVHDVATGKRAIVASFKGSNSAPAWSPDGGQLAVVLSKDGNSQLYLVTADGSNARRIASSSAIDTEPRYSPDGVHIYFTSNRGGSPQIYRVSVAGGDTERVTFEGRYNVTPRPSPDGKSLAYITQSNGRFQLSVMDLASKQTTILTDTDKDESPSFAPNGKMILYATDIGGRGVLAATSLDGRVKQNVTLVVGDAREPSWGPFLGR